MKKTAEKGVVIGIDLGTTYSVAAIYESDGTCKVIQNKDGDLITPSVVNLRDETKPYVGRAAVNQYGFVPEYTASLFKRSMGKLDTQGQPIPAFVHPDSGKAYPPEELSSLVIRYLVESVEAAVGVKVKGVVISVPAYFDESAREATRRAGKLAGVNVLRIINEPTAGGLAFGLDRDEAGTFSVFDLGGGTFDITILEIKDGNFSVLTTDGDRDLGGADIDNLILAKAVAAFQAEYSVEISPDSDLILWRELLSKSEEAKKTLSQAESASFMISAQGNRLIFDLMRSDFNTLIAPIIDKTKVITERAFEAATLEPKAIDGALLVGGSTRIPAVCDMLTALFGKKPRTDINPDEAVARGAAIFAARMAHDQQIAVVDTEGQKVLPPPVSVTDVTSHPLGCIALVDGVLRNCVIIPANTKLPAEREDTFALVHEHQTEANVILSRRSYRHLTDDRIRRVARLYGFSVPQENATFAPRAPAG